MSFSEWLKKERLVWHKRFIPSLIAGISVALISLFFSITTTNVVLFASLGSSAVILTHKQIHKLGILRTVIISYFIALIVSLVLKLLLQKFDFSFSVAFLVAVTLTTLIIYLADVFHPPAVAASLAFIMMDSSFIETIVIFFSVIVLLIVI